MRLVRLVALFGSLLLLVVTTVSLLNRRAENRSDQISKVQASADLITVAVRANVNSTREAVEIAGVAASAPVVDRSRLAAEVATMLTDSEACVGASVAECTGADLFALEQIQELAPRSVDEAIAVVDAATDSVLFVHRPAVDGNAVTVVLRVPVTSLVRPATMEIATGGSAEVTLQAASRNTGDVRDDARLVDKKRVVDATIGEPFVDGSITVRTSIDGRIGLAGGSPTLYGSLLGLGTVLLALAGWTFLAERRSLEKRASTDDLTGLINRRQFENVAEEELETASRFGTGLCVMVIDLNGFKQVNDTLGHQFGDLVLKASAERLVAAVRDTDIVGRWGGDEFVIMLPGLEDRTAVRASAERISRTLSDEPVVGDTRMSASIGAAIYPRHGTTLDGLMRAADVAMYGAKTTGVSHRIADTITAQDDLLGESIPDTSLVVEAEELRPVVHTDQYAGPDRRRSPVPPPPPTPASAGAEVRVDDATHTDRVDHGSEARGSGGALDEQVDLDQSV